MYDGSVANGARRRITIITIGSRGDVQPYVALGLGLQRAGHVVTLATHETFRGFVTGRRLGFAPISGDPYAVIRTRESEQWLQSGRRRDLLPAARTFLRGMRPLVDAMLDDYWRVAQGSDLLLYSTVAAPVWSVAERLGIPSIAAWLQPLHRTRVFPTIGAQRITSRSTSRSFGGVLNAATHTLVHQFCWQLFRGQINAWRRETLGLPPVPLRGPFPRLGIPPRPTLYGFSPLVVPRPADWASVVQVTGYWVLDPDPTWRPSARLDAFLAAGPPPVYIGFGSMTPQHAERLATIAIDALRRTGLRGILGRGWGTLGDGALPATVMAVDDVPHEWLFPRMAAIVHHGGAGTTGAALRAGVPSIVVPLGFDQAYWGSRVATLGVGPRPRLRSEITVDWLSRSIQHVLDDTALRTRAAVLGRALRAERGVETAVSLVEAFVTPHAP